MLSECFVVVWLCVQEHFSEKVVRIAYACYIAPPICPSLSLFLPNSFISLSLFNKALIHCLPIKAYIHAANYQWHDSFGFVFVRLNCALPFPSFHFDIATENQLPFNATYNEYVKDVTRDSSLATRSLSHLTCRPCHMWDTTVSYLTMKVQCLKTDMRLSHTNTYLSHTVTVICRDSTQLLVWPTANKKNQWIVCSIKVCNRVTKKFLPIHPTSCCPPHGSQSLSCGKNSNTALKQRQTKKHSHVNTYIECENVCMRLYKINIDKYRLSFQQINSINPFELTYVFLTKPNVAKLPKQYCYYYYGKSLAKV